MKLYIAHPEWTSKGIREWHQKIDIPNLELVNPFLQPGEDISKLEAGQVSAVNYHKNLDAEMIVERDVDLIAQCDGVLAIVSPWDSYGTHMEMVYADILKKPIYAVVLRERDKYHPWIIEHSKKIFTSKTQFKKWAEKQEWK